MCDIPPLEPHPFSSTIQSPDSAQNLNIDLSQPLFDDPAELLVRGVDFSDLDLLADFDQGGRMDSGIDFRHNALERTSTMRWNEVDAVSLDEGLPASDSEDYPLQLDFERRSNVPSDSTLVEPKPGKPLPSKTPITPDSAPSPRHFSSMLDLREPGRALVPTFSTVWTFDESKDVASMINWSARRELRAI
jgi:hypothetical protein